VSRAGGAKEAVERRLLQGVLCRQAVLEHGLEQIDPSPGDPGFVAGGAKNRAGGLTKAAPVAAGDLSADVDCHALPLRMPIRFAPGPAYFLPGSLPGANRPAGSKACLSLCRRDPSTLGGPKTS